MKFFTRAGVHATTGLACVAGPKFYEGPDLQRAGFWRARGRIEGLQESPPFMTICRSDSEREYDHLIGQYKDSEKQ
jgi:hypothetical protein